MGRFLLYRLLRTIPATWAIVSFVFLLSRALPTNDLLGQALSDDSVGNRGLTAAEREAALLRIQERLGLTGPVFYFSCTHSTTGAVWQWHGSDNQYHKWLKKAVKGDLGQSYRSGQPVTAVLGEALRFTLPLTTSAALLATVLSVVLALWLVCGGPAFLLSMLYAIDALPLFVVALGLLLLLANPDILPLFPAYGMGQQTADNAPWHVQISTYLYYSTLPLASLVLVKLPSLVVQLYDALRHELGANYATTARAKGLSAYQVATRHALRNALLPVIALLTDLLPALVAGAVVVEVIFALPGMGRLMAEAAATHDFPVLVGGVLLMAIMRLIGLVVADTLYFLTDPRIRLQA
ncbi:binding-protein-dependent transport systems inner membrane component [Hymenobacter roseosalivarius DSM 11622]|uniref:Binding-protein-dependent transport systems inner membrane component n=1 Tax=Hymenobacter roseosalivarius DSM 11622 TaxID=645990 RepID=A0A1W1VU28_9BACT|nr:ABC transporter permease [Hymenobacter roseosalivarius]SMB96740.1 binding-protein-dependent transport systems inner membrane component [Hymenobacter roseosalivarius DSM 11622]